MTIKSTLIDIGILLGAALGGVAGGYGRGYADGVGHDNTAVVAAQRDTQTAQANTAKVQLALDQLHALADAQRALLLQAQQRADAAVAAGDTLKTQLAAATRQRVADDETIAHENPDCAALERLPVCPELARRLWPGAPTQAAGDATVRGAGH